MKLACCDSLVNGGGNLKLSLVTGEVKLFVCAVQFDE